MALNKNCDQNRVWKVFYGPAKQQEPDTAKLYFAQFLTLDEHLTKQSLKSVPNQN